MLGIIDMAQKLWPKATDVEIGLLARIFEGVRESKAIDILEEARIDCQYAAIPFKAIKAKTGNLATRRDINGRYIECMAVHYQTGKSKDCMVLAQNDIIAKGQMEKYLRDICKVSPVDYVLFIGEGSRQAALKYRMNK